MKIRLSVERDLEQIVNIGDCVSHLCGREKEYISAYHLELMIAELLTNIVKHSRPNEEDPGEFPVAVTLVTKNDVITLSVSEYGEPISRDVVKQYTETEIDMPSVEGDILDLPESGWGVQLIKSICDDISYERLDGSNVFHLCFDLNALAA